MPRLPAPRSVCKFPPKLALCMAHIDGLHGDVMPLCPASEKSQKGHVDSLITHQSCIPKEYRPTYIDRACSGLAILMAGDC